MAAPTLESVFPSPDATGIPIGASIALTFSVGVDLEQARKHIVLYGQDFDQTSGPENATWQDRDTGDNPFFLRSPGFHGFVDCEYELVYVDGDGDEIDPQPEFTSRDAETASGYRCRILVIPKRPLAPETQYTCYVIGEEAGTNRGVSSRTHYEPDLTSVVSETGEIVVSGTYSGDGDDLLHLEVTTAGDIGTAKYKLWYETEDEVDARTGKVTSRRFRSLEDSLQVRFTGSGFLMGDDYQVRVYEPERLETSYRFSFTTGTGNIEEVPETASTSVLGGESSLSSEATPLTVVSMDPEDGATHQPLSKTRIQIEFSGNLDPTTVTQDTVTVLAYPVSGRYAGAEPNELMKKLTVSGPILMIEL